MLSSWNNLPTDYQQILGSWNILSTERQQMIGSWNKLPIDFQKFRPMKCVIHRMPNIFYCHEWSYIPSANKCYAHDQVINGKPKNVRHMKHVT